MAQPLESAPKNHSGPDPSIWQAAAGYHDELVRLHPTIGALGPQSGPNTWNALGLVLWDYVRAIAVSGSDVYAGGNLANASGDSDADYVPRWDGSAWQSLGTPLDGSVRAIAMVASDVYVGGDFSDAGGNANTDHIARWNGSAWHPPGYRAERRRDRHRCEWSKCVRGWVLH